MLVQILSGIEHRNGRMMPSGEGIYCDVFATKRANNGTHYFRVLKKEGNTLSFVITEGRNKATWLFGKGHDPVGVFRGVERPAPVAAPVPVRSVRALARARKLAAQTAAA